MIDKLMTAETKKLMEAFKAAGFEVRFVGGCVRDAILGVIPKDIDFCTDATPDEMKDIAEKNDFKFLPTGIQHGTATIVINSEPFEVTTLRIDVDTDGRHADVAFTRSFELDAERRDLTINAMSMDGEGVIYDYFDGKEDLDNRRVRFVGVPELRIHEDYLRILRYFRFAARFDAKMDQDTLDIFNTDEVLDRLNEISVERFWQEMSKLLDPKMPGRVRIVDAIFKNRVNRSLGLFRFNPVELAYSASPLAALSTMIHKDDVGKFFNFWKMSTDEKSFIQKMIAMRFVDWSEEVVEDMMVNGMEARYIVEAATLVDRQDIADYATNYIVPVFPVRGQDLVDSGMKPGAEIGKRMARMKEEWKASRFTKTFEELMEVQ